MTSAKFVLIGGGSYGWTPTLLTDMALNPDLKGLHVVLHDINPAPLKTIVPLCQKIVKAVGADLTIEGSTNLDVALPGADFVGLTISTGGNDANRLDMEIPLRYGIFQTVGDTVGPGGWSRALRNIPVVVDIIRKVERLAANAWFMNYSNPMTTLTRTLHKTSRVRSVGICHELQGLLLHAAYFFGVDWEKDFSCTVAGINHLIWILEMSVKGHDGLALMKAYANDPVGFKKIGPLGIPQALIDGGGVAPSQKVKFDLLQRTGYLPAAGDAHIAEFLPFYLNPATEAERWGFHAGKKAHTFARTEAVSARQRKCEDLLAGRLPLELRHSHEHADRTIAALMGTGAPFVTPLNLANRGQIDNVPREAVVETLAYLSDNNVQPLTVGPLPDCVLRCVMQHIPNQEMIVEAGLTGNRDLAVLALANDPAVPNPDVAAKMAADFFAEFRELLPQFNGKWTA
jgi:alpha-galactosidase